MANSTDSTSVDHFSPSFSSSRLIQTFPHHDTVKLDKKNFVQWQQHIKLITKGYELQGFLEAAKTAYDVWNIVNRLFATSTGAKISRIKHELHSLKKGTLPITKYIAKILNTCALLEALGSVVSEAEKVEETLPFQKLVDVLLKFKSRQLQVVQDVPMLANMAEALPVVAVTESNLRTGRSGHSSSGSRGCGFCPRIQCQICGRYRNLAQCCFYHFNLDYGGLSEPILA
ncbi:hypothetical protein PVK06_012737 [Gossypium arboreum]|uniref:Retrotransposon Copia-like N-terminal domain-containing protein n=1 Tax=Gossypium arboreum TaxID=29729 RepID=A0ABR0QD24_GOSAR|nr:hypothetical protein PVK06_012737 [Gossypium arboreum]